MNALVDTSVWIEFLRGTETPATRHLRRDLGRRVVTSEPVMLELLAGAMPGPRTSELERLLLSQTWFGIEPRLDYRGAVEVFHATRATGHQPRSLQDCLIAAIALRGNRPVAHRDVDYEHIAAATGLETVDLRD